MRIVFIFFLVITTCVIHAQSLSDYQRMAADSNLGLRIAYKKVEMQLQQIPQIAAHKDPNFSFAYFIRPMGLIGGNQRATLSLMQMFPWFGTLRLKKNRVAQLAESKYQAFLNQKNKLFHSVATSYYKLYELNKMIDIERENLMLLNAHKDIAMIQFKNAQVGLVDVLRLEILIKESITQIEILDKKQYPLRIEFNNILNQNSTTQIHLPDSLNFYPINATPYADTLFASHPQVKSADASILASEISENIAKRQSFPKMGLGLNYMIIDERPGNLASSNGMDMLMPMISLSIPLARSKYKAAQKEARISQEALHLQKKMLQYNLHTKYDMLVFQMDKQYKLLRLYTEQINTLQRTLKLLFASYSTEGKDFDALLDLEQKLLKYKKMKLEALVALLINQSAFTYITTE